MGTLNIQKEIICFRFLWQNPENLLPSHVEKDDRKDHEDDHEDVKDAHKVQK